MGDSEPQFYYLHAGPESERIGPFADEKEARAAERLDGAEVAVILRRVPKGYMPVPDTALPSAAVMLETIDRALASVPTAERSADGCGR
jgi:hypothetical protein